MTSTPVMNSMVSPVANLLNTQQNDKTGTTDFKDFLKQSESGMAKNNPKAKEKLSNTDTVEGKSEKTEMTGEAKEVNKPSDAKASERDVTSKDTDKVTDTVKEVVEEVAKELDVDAEEIEAVLESMGYTLFALLDTEILPTIVAKITGSEDVLSLTTDENLYQNLTNVSKEVSEAVEMLSKEFDIPVEELETAVKEFESFKNVITDDMTSENLEGKETEFADKIQITSKETLSKTNAQNSEIAKINLEEETELPEANTVNAEFERNDDSKRGTNSEFAGHQMTFAQNLLARTTEAMNATSETVTYTAFDVENIMNQLTEGIDVNVTPETSEINLKLHPESLGTVSVKVSSNHEGVLTAQFTAQNESVKAIIESQALVLRETLESKGVTVEAVEVMVQSHGFERNLNGESKGSGEQSQPSKRGIRRINLSNPEDDIEESDDNLVREMMAQNGNTVDYSA